MAKKHTTTLAAKIVPAVCDASHCAATLSAWRAKKPLPSNPCLDPRSTIARARALAPSLGAALALRARSPQSLYQPKGAPLGLPRGDDSAPAPRAEPKPAPAPAEKPAKNPRRAPRDIVEARKAANAIARAAYDAPDRDNRDALSETQRADAAIIARLGTVAHVETRKQGDDAFGRPGPWEVSLRLSENSDEDMRSCGRAGRAAQRRMDAFGPRAKPWRSTHTGCDAWGAWPWGSGKEPPRYGGQYPPSISKSVAIRDDLPELAAAVAAVVADSLRADGYSVTLDASSTLAAIPEGISPGLTSHPGGDSLATMAQTDHAAKVAARVAERTDGDEVEAGLDVRREAETAVRRKAVESAAEWILAQPARSVRDELTPAQLESLAGHMERDISPAMLQAAGMARDDVASPAAAFEDARASLEEKRAQERKLLPKRRALSGIVGQEPTADERAIVRELFDGTEVDLWWSEAGRSRVQLSLRVKSTGPEDVAALDYAMGQGAAAILRHLGPLVVVEGEGVSRFTLSPLLQRRARAQGERPYGYTTSREDERSAATSAVLTLSVDRVLPWLSYDAINAARQAIIGALHELGGSVRPGSYRPEDGPGRIGDEPLSEMVLRIADSTLSREGEEKLYEGQAQAVATLAATLLANDSNTAAQLWKATESGTIAAALKYPILREAKRAGFEVFARDAALSTEAAEAMLRRAQGDLLAELRERFAQPDARAAEPSAELPTVIRETTSHPLARAQLAVAYRPAKGVLIWGKGTFAAKEILRALGLRIVDGMIPGEKYVWVDARRASPGVIPWEYQRAVKRLARDGFKLHLEYPAGALWETEEAYEGRKNAVVPMAPVVVRYTPMKQGAGVYYVDGDPEARRAAWSAVLKPAGFTFHGKPSECRYSGSCPACALGLEMRAWTRDPTIAGKLRSSMDADAAAAYDRGVSALAASSAVDAELSCPLPPGINLYGYQRAGVAYALKAPNVMIADDMGLGKTPQSIVALNCDPEIKRVVVIVPASLRLNWTKEIPRFSSRPASVVRLRPSPAARKNETAADALERGRARNREEVTKAPPPGGILWVVASYEDTLSQHSAAVLREAAFDAIVLDEAQAIKNAAAKRTEAVTVLWDRARLRRMILTGTPIENNLAELYTLVSLLDSKTYPRGGEFPKRYKYRSSERAKLENELRQRYMIRRLKKDVLLDLPEKRWSLVYLDESDEGIQNARERWGAFLKKYDLDEKGESSEEAKQARADRAAQLAVAEAIGDRHRVQELATQVVGGEGVPFEELARERSWLGVDKVAVAIEHIKSVLESQPASERALVVWCHHNEVAQSLAAGISAAGYRCAYSNGTVDAETRARGVADFQAGALDVLVCTIRAMGTGHTLVRANHAVFVELDWTPAKIAQAEDRIYRIGQKRGVLIEYLIAEGTMDARMLELLQEKELLIESTLDNKADATGGADMTDKLPSVARSGTRDEDADAERAERDWSASTRSIKRAISTRLDKIFAYTAEEKRILHTAINTIASVCDGAHEKDDCGFSGSDVAVGWQLAQYPAERWNDRAATLAHRLAIKYQGQLGGVPEIPRQSQRAESTEPAPSAD